MYGGSMTATHGTLITREEAASRLHVDLRTLARYLAIGKLTKYKNGLGRVLVDEDEVAGLLEAKPQPVPAQRGASE